MKKVFIGVLAALMLFAFTACEQQMPNFLTKTPSAIVLDQVSDLFNGDTVEASDFNVIVTYEDGTETTYPGANLVKYDVATGTYSATVGKVTGTAYASYSTISGIDSVTLKDDLQVVVGNATLKAYSEATVGFTYVNHKGETKTGTKAITADNTVGTWTADSEWVPSNAKVGDKVTFTFALSDYKDDKFEFTAEVVAAKATKADVTRLEVTYDSVIKYGTAFVKPTVVGYTASNEKVELKETTDYVFGNGIPSGNITSLDPISFSVYFVVGNSQNPNTVAPVTLNYTVADQINTTGLTLTYTGTAYVNEVTKVDTNLIKAEATYQGNTSAKENNFTFFIDGSPEIKPTSTTAVKVSVKWTCVPTGQTGTADLSITPVVKPAN